MSNINRVSRSSANSAGLQEKLEGGHQKCGKDAGGDLLGQTGRSETTLSGRGGIAGSGGTTRAGSRGRGCCAASSSRRRRSSGGGLRKGFGGGIASTTLLVRSTGGLSLSIVGMVVNTLDIGLLTNVERQGLGECCAVRHGSVGADAGVGEAGLEREVNRYATEKHGLYATYLITFVLRRRTTADLRASVQLSMAPVDYTRISTCFPPALLWFLAYMQWSCRRSLG